MNVGKLMCCKLVLKRNICNKWSDSSPSSDCVIMVKLHYIHLFAAVHQSEFCQCADRNSIHCALMAFEL